MRTSDSPSATLTTAVGGAGVAAGTTNVTAAHKSPIPSARFADTVTVHIPLHRYRLDRNRTVRDPIRQTSSLKPSAVLATGLAYPVVLNVPRLETLLPMLRDDLRPASKLILLILLSGKVNAIRFI